MDRRPKVRFPCRRGSRGRGLLGPPYIHRGPKFNQSTKRFQRDFLEQELKYAAYPMPVPRDSENGRVFKAIECSFRPIVIERVFGLGLRGLLVKLFLFKGMRRMYIRTWSMKRRTIVP